MAEDNVTPIRSAAVAQPPARFPISVEEKVMVAKSIVMAVMAADQSGELEGKNYDRFWPLKMATELLEQAENQIDQEQFDRARQARQE